MTTLRFLGAAVAAGAVAACVSGQTPYPQPYPQASPGYGYPNQSYGPNVIQQIIDQLLGNRYSVTDRTLVSRCASAALAQAQRQYPYGAYGRGYPQPYADGQRNYPVAMMRVAAITEVQRRSSGLRVRGLIDSGAYGSPMHTPMGISPMSTRGMPAPATSRSDAMSTIAATSATCGSAATPPIVADT